MSRRHHTEFVPSPRSIVNFWNRVNKDGPIPEHCPERGPCWLWTGTQGARCGEKRYGKLMVQSRLIRTHRFSWVLANGQVPDGLCVLHHCDNPPCVNPAHLFLGTHEDNAADRHAKGRESEPEITSHKGEDHGMAKISADDACKIREHRAATGETFADIGVRFNLTGIQIRRICTGEQWQDADGPCEKPLKNLKGTNNPASKLTEDNVRTIRREYADGTANMQVLANRFGVSKQVVFGIIHNRTWKHVT